VVLGGGKKPAAGALKGGGSFGGVAKGGKLSRSWEAVQFQESKSPQGGGGLPGVSPRGIGGKNRPKGRGGGGNQEI